MDWIDLAQNRNQWRALHEMLDIIELLERSWVAERLAASQEGSSSAESLNDKYSRLLQRKRWDALVLVNETQ
jgi:hypothetical protein